MDENEPKKPSWVEWPFKWIDGYGESTRRIIQNVISWAIVGALGLTIGYFWSNHDWLTQGSKSAWNLLKYPITLQAWVVLLASISVNWFSILVYRSQRKKHQALSQEAAEIMAKLSAKPSAPKTNEEPLKQVADGRRILLTGIVDIVNVSGGRDTLGALVSLANSIESENDVKWLCQELVKHNYQHPFEVFEMASDNALNGKWLKLLREARLANPPIKNDLGMLSFLATKWSEKDAWLTAKRKHDETVQAASMAHVFGNQTGHRCSSCGSLVLINTDTEAYKCGCGHEEIVKPKPEPHKPLIAVNGNEYTAIKNIHTALLPMLRAWQNCRRLLGDDELEWRQRAHDFDELRDNFGKVFDESKVEISDEQLLNEMLQVASKAREFVSRMGRAITFQRMYSENVEMIEQHMAPIVALENEIPQLQQALEKKIRSILTGK
jgi:DNA-directed RNA polymerase subunit RPC12/RpoP